MNTSTRYAAIAMLGILASIALFFVASSILFLMIMKAWNDPYYVGSIERFYAWIYYSDARGWSRFLWLACGAVGLAVLCVGLRLTWRLILREKRKPLYGRAKWQSVFGAYVSGLRFRIKPKPDEILIGTKIIFSHTFYVTFPGDRHISLTSPTGGGKSVSFVIPNALNWGGPLFVFSVKRDVLEATAAERERMGRRVFVYDVTEPNGMTHCWNGFDSVSRETGDAYDDIQRAMWHIIPETRANNPYWDNAARMVATAIGVMLYETPGRTLSIGEILRVVEINTYDSDLRDMIFRSRVEGRPYPLAAVSIVLTWLDNKAEEAAAAVRSNIVTALSIWHVPRIDSATSRSDFSLEGIRENDIDVFVCAQPGDIRRLRTIYGLFFTQLVHKNSRVDFDKLPTKPKIRTLCILDEMWALGEMKELADALAFMRSFGIRFAPVLQTKDQIIKSFGEEGARNLFNNTAVELVFGEGTQETAKEVSERGGFTTVDDTSTSKPKWTPFQLGKHNENTGVKQRALILPQEVSAIDASKVIVQMKGKPHFQCDRILWYSNPYFSVKRGDVPPMPRLEVHTPRDMEAINLSD